MPHDCANVGVDLDEFDDVLDGSDAPRQLLPRRDTGSSSIHSKGDRSVTAWHSHNPIVGTSTRDDDEFYDTKDQLAEAKMLVEAYAKELKRTRGEMRAMGHHINGLEHERQRLKEANQSYEDELAIVRRELQEAKNLASIRGKELVGAQVFLTKADALSLSEVIEKVTNLNEEIFQAAKLLGEALIHKPHNLSQEEMDCVLGIAQGMLSSKMIHILQSCKEVPEANPLLVHIVLQVFLVTYCSLLVQSWSNDPHDESHLSAIYSRIRDKEEQVVSGRWRALTRSHTPVATEGWKQDLLRKLRSVLRVASWITPSAQQRDAFEQKLETIFCAVVDLRNALGEKFTTVDLEVSVMEGDQVFQPAYMEDAYGDSRKYAPQEVVVGTTGIGLKKATLQRSERGDVMFANVLSAEVVLESTLLEALQPSPSPKSGRRKITKPNEVLSPPPKKDSGAGTPKPSSYASKAPTAHASQVGIAPSYPPAPPKKGPTSVELVEQQQQRGIPESPKDSAGAGSAPQQRKLNHPPNRGPSLDSAGGSSRPQRPGQQRELSILERSAGDNARDGGGILGALQQLEY